MGGSQTKSQLFKHPNQVQDSFSASTFESLYQWEKEHFWFQARSERIIGIIEKYLKGTGNFLEIGCGTGLVLEALSRRFPDLVLTGAEIIEEGISYARKRNPDVHFFQADARHLEFTQEWDGIGLFDVLEHIAEDEQVLSRCHDAMKAEGKLFLTVPQHMLLWSALDDASYHKRRYSRNELLEKVRKAGFKILSVNSFNCLLLPLLFVSRFLQRKKFHPAAETRLPQWLHSLLRWILMTENRIASCGIPLFWGGSLVVAATKRETA